MDMPQDKYTITELSRKLNLTDHALRYYEKEFNLNIDRDSRGRRYYTPENANLMYTIKKMRDEGIGIKAIKKILESKNLIPHDTHKNTEHPVLVSGSSANTFTEVRKIFDGFRQELVQDINDGLNTAKEDLICEIRLVREEITSSMDERTEKMEMKMEKHFSEIDRALSQWRDKRKKGLFGKIFRKEKQNS